MKKVEFTYPSHDGKTQIHAICWEPDEKPAAVLQISHGMVEYIDRYDEFAAFLTRQGYVVVGNDHLGHGKSVQDDSWLGYFAEKEGNKVVLRDIHRLRLMIQKRFPDVPYFILGHSMGSFLVRQYLCLHGSGLAGAIIMGTGHQPRIATAFGMALCKTMALFTGWHYRSFLVDAMAFGGYNRKFGSLKGRQWLSRNEENVAAYVKDPLCTYRFTLNGYYNLFYSIHMLSDEEILAKMPKNLPIFLVAGEDDPVGNAGESVKKVYEQFKRLGMKDVTLKLYPQDRHEILNEVDREDVYWDIFHWMEYMRA